MPTGNFHEPRPFRLPADYYSAPLSEVKPIFPAWVPWGCGTAAAIFLIILFVGGAVVTGPRLNSFLDLILGITVGELKGMYAEDVTDTQKTDFEAAVKQLRENLRESKISVQDVQPFLQQMQTTIRDRKVTPRELAELTQTARKVGSGGVRSGNSTLRGRVKLNFQT